MKRHPRSRASQSSIWKNTDNLLPRNYYFLPCEGSKWKMFFLMFRKTPYVHQGTLAGPWPFAQEASPQAPWKLVGTAQAAEERGSKWDTASPSINPDWSARGDVLSSGFGSKPDGDKKCQTGSDQRPIQVTAASDRGTQRCLVEKHCMCLLWHQSSTMCKVLLQQTLLVAHPTSMPPFFHEEEVPILLRGPHPHHKAWDSIPLAPYQSLSTSALLVFWTRELFAVGTWWDWALIGSFVASLTRCAIYYYNSHPQHPVVTTKSICKHRP